MNTRGMDPQEIPAYKERVRWAGARMKALQKKRSRLKVSMFSKPPLEVTDEEIRRELKGGDDT